MSSANHVNAFQEIKLSFPILKQTEGQGTHVKYLRYLHVADNGIAVLTQKSISVESAQLLQNPGNILLFRFLSDFDILLAPMWMRSGLKPNNSSKVCISDYSVFGLPTDRRILRDVDDAVRHEVDPFFESVYVVVATWHDIATKWESRLKQKNASPSKQDSFTFQLIIATDSKSTYALTAHGRLAQSSVPSQTETDFFSGPAVLKGYVTKNNDDLPSGSS